MKNLTGILITIVYIALILGVSAFLYNKKKIGKEEARKLIHIGLCNCYLIAWIMMDHPLVASALPFLFIFINLFSHYKNILPMMERKEKNFGTVYYAISLTILTFILFQTKNFAYIGAIAVLVLGYADGLAGLLGNSFKKYRFSNGKSLGGSTIFFVTAFLVSYAILSFSVGANLYLYCFIIASVATSLELISSRGLDNLTIPLGVAIMTYYMTLNPVILTISFALSINCIIAILAYSGGFLDGKGCVGAVLLGTVTYSIGGVPAFLALLTFFVGSNLLTCNFKKKTNTKRDLGSVFCNGIIFLFCLVLFYLTNLEVFLVGFFIALAGASSDTWSSELGQKGKVPVRYILSRKKVEKGISGGVTPLGILGSCIGSFLIAIFSFFVFKEKIAIYFVTILCFGFLTSVIDSIFGELFQAKFKHKKTKKIVEKRVGKKTLYEKVKGIEWMDNHLVNLTSILLSTCLGILLIYFL